jgi:hypothetical protein
MITAAMRARHYEKGDIIAHIVPEYAHLKLEPDNCWVVEDEEGVVVGAVLVTVGNEIACVIRVAGLPEAPLSWVLCGLRMMVRDLHERGVKVLVACFNVTRVEELKLARLMQKAGGELAPLSGFVAAVAVEQVRRW